MLNIRKLTSTKTKIEYIVFESLYYITYMIYPIFLMLFVDNISIYNINECILYAILLAICFIVMQVFGYFFSLASSKVERENYINYFNSLNEITKRQDLTINEINNNELSQNMGQYYEQSKYLFFIDKVEFYISLALIIIITIILFFISYIVALIMLFFVPLCFFITKKFENKLSDNGRKNTENLDLVKGYLLDQNIE